MGDHEVDALLEQAFQKVEEVERSGGDSKHPMDDLIMQEAKRVGITELKKSESSKKRHNDDDDDNKDSEKSNSRKNRRDNDRKKEERRHRSPSSESRSKKRSRSRDRKRRRSRSRSGSPSRRTKSSRRSRSPARKRSRSPARRRSRSPRRRSRSRSPFRASRGSRESPGWRRSPPRGRLPGPERRDVMPFSPKRSPPRNAKTDMTAEERDERTIFILQLSRNTRPRDLEEFFSSVGHVRDVRIITDSKTRRTKGIAYVEFWEKESVPLAMGLNGQKLLNAPLIIQMTCAERNRMANASVGGAIGLGIAVTSGPLKICVNNLHAHITDDMLSAIFEPFGKITRCSVVRDSAGVSKGYGNVTFRHSDEGKKAFEQLNGFELAGKNIRLTTVDEEYAGDGRQEQQQSLESEDRMEMNSHGRLQLMAKLAEGSGMQLPQSTRDALAQQQQAQEAIPSIATQCFMLSNMFDAATETESNWDGEVRDDIIDECNSHGGVLHVYVDKASPQGNVYVKCPSVAVAHRSVVALHGRYFSGKVITANYVPVNSYHGLFPDARTAVGNLTTARH